jgi:hypothetical protein
MTFQLNDANGSRGSNGRIVQSPHENSTRGNDMAKKRWATFFGRRPPRRSCPRARCASVRSPCFPVPSRRDRVELLKEKRWDPKLLGYCLLKLEDLAIPVQWGVEQRQQFRTNMEQAREIKQLTLNPTDWVHDQDEHQNGKARSKMTRGMITAMTQDMRGTEYWVMPSYRSREGFLNDQRTKIAAADGKVTSRGACAPGRSGVVRAGRRGR